MKESYDIYIDSVYEDAAALNRIQYSEHFGDTDWPHTFVFAGWDQNPDVLARFQQALEAEGTASTAWSVFDTVDPLRKDVSLDKIAAEYDLELGQEFESVAPRMLLRAVRLLETIEAIVGPEYDEIGQKRPDTAIAQCAGSNVLLLAHCIAAQNGKTDLLPSSVLLAEPMLVEGLSVRGMATAFAKHERAAEEDPQLISLKAMRHPDNPDLGIAGKEPLGDILGSEGVTHLGHVAASGLDVVVLLGEEDVAAPLEQITSQLTDRGIDIPVLTFAKQKRVGHGYTFAEPEEAAATFSWLLS